MNSTKNRYELRCMEGQVIHAPLVASRISVTLVTNVISHERGKDLEVLMTRRGTYLWSFVPQIFRNGQPSQGGHRKTIEVMTSS